MIIIGIIVVVITVFILAHEQPGINRACEEVENGR